MSEPDEGGVTVELSCHVKLKHFFNPPPKENRCNVIVKIIKSNLTSCLIVYFLLLPWRQVYFEIESRWWKIENFISKPKLNLHFCDSDPIWSITGH